MWKDFCRRLLFVFFWAATAVWFSGYLYQQSAAWMLDADVTVTDEFREMRLSNAVLSVLLQASGSDAMPPGDILTTLFPFSTGGDLGDNRLLHSRKIIFSDLNLWRTRFMKRNRSGYLKVRTAYAAIWNDVKCFPVTGTEISYENSWMFERTYGGKRGHEGTDLMPSANLAGVYPVISMTDGVVEKIGWLEQGGYRIGIRSPNGGYFYYAHLDAYAQEFAVGDAVYAGEQLGLMGDSGYGEEGTVGKFAVHLHVGIYIYPQLSDRTARETGEDTGEQNAEVSVNPYWVLRYAEMLG